LQQGVGTVELDISKGIGNRSLHPCLRVNERCVQGRTVPDNASRTHFHRLRHFSKAGVANLLRRRIHPIAFRTLDADNLLIISHLNEKSADITSGRIVEGLLNIRPGMDLQKFDAFFIIHNAYSLFRLLLAIKNHVRPETPTKSRSQGQLYIRHLFLTRPSLNLKGYFSAADKSGSTDRIGGNNPA